jgi:hypothetical protein
MNSLPKYMPLQWIIIEGENAFAQIINGQEKPEGGWTYRISIEGSEQRHIDEEDILACLVDGKWVKKSIVTTQSVYS